MASTQVGGAPTAIVDARVRLMTFRWDSAVHSHISASKLKVVCNSSRRPAAWPTARQPARAAPLRPTITAPLYPVIALRHSAAREATHDTFHLERSCIGDVPGWEWMQEVRCMPRQDEWPDPAQAK